MIEAANDFSSGGAQGVGVSVWVEVAVGVRVVVGVDVLVAARVPVGVTLDAIVVCAAGVTDGTFDVTVEGRFVAVTVGVLTSAMAGFTVTAIATGSLATPAVLKACTVSVCVPCAAFQVCARGTVVAVEGTPPPTRPEPRHSNR